MALWFAFFSVLLKEIRICRNSFLIISCDLFCLALALLQHQLLSVHDMGVVSLMSPICPDTEMCSHNPWVHISNTEQKLDFYESEETHRPLAYHRLLQSPRLSVTPLDTQHFQVDPLKPSIVPTCHFLYSIDLKPNKLE